MANHCSILALRTSRTVAKRQKDVKPKDEPHRAEAVQYAAREERTATNRSRKNEKAGPKRKQCSVVDVSGMKVKSDAVE